MAVPPLLSSKTPGIILAEIRMMSSTFKGVHFLVEGDDDSQFWKPRLSRERVAIVNCEGKPNLIGAATQVTREGITCVAGVYDPDFERLQGISHFPHLLVPTDLNDLEATLLFSAALDSMLHEFADANLMAQLEQAIGISIVEHIARIAREFGRLRYLNHLLNHRVDFDRLSPYRFVSADDWSLDQLALLGEYATLAGISIDDLEQALNSHCGAPDPRHYCQGHDSLKVLAQGLRRKIARRQINDQDVARLLRLSYTREMLIRSEMYKTLNLLQGELRVRLFDH